MQMVQVAPPRQSGLTRTRATGVAVWRWALRTRTLPPARLKRGDWGYIAATFLLSRLLIFALGVIGSAMFPVAGANQTWTLQPITWQTLSLWSHIYDRFDSGWYIGIANGYPAVIPGHLDSLRIWGFLPGYPIALHIVALGLGLLRVPGSTGALAGVIVSHLALFGAVIYLYRLTAAELDSAAARRAVTYLLVFPSSLFLSAVYPEGMLLFATVGAFYHARRRQWLWAGLLAALAVITHTEGVIALAPLTLEFFAYYAARGGWQWGMLKLSWLLAPPLGALGVYALYSHARTGYWLAFATSQTLVWGHRLAPPLYPFIGFLLHPGIGGAFDFDFHLLNIAVATLALLFSVVAFRRLPPAYGLWLLLGVLLPLSTDGSHTHSLARHVGALAPLFVALAAWSLRLRAGVATRERPASQTSLDLRDRLVLLPSVLFLALYTLMLTAGIWAAI